MSAALQELPRGEIHAKSVQIVKRARASHRFVSRAAPDSQTLLVAAAFPATPQRQELVRTAQTCRLAAAFGRVNTHSATPASVGKTVKPAFVYSLGRTAHAPKHAAQ